MRHPWTVPPGYRTAPLRFNIATEVVDRRVAQGAGDIALRDARGAVTFAELADLVARCAGGLQSLGVQRGTPFLVRSPNCREAYVVFLAGVKLGAMPILANSLLGARDLGHVVENGEPVLAVVHVEAVVALAEVQRGGYRFRHVVSIGDAIPGATTFDALCSAGKPAETADTGRDDPAFINYTSGTTGVPKGIVQAHRWVVANGDLARLHMPLTSADVVLNTSEFSFGWGLGHGLLWPLRNGGSVAILGARPTAERLLAAVETFGVTVVATVPTMIRAILAVPDIEKRHHVASLRMAYAAGEPLAEPTYREWCRRFPCDLYDAYGASEFQVIVANGPGMPVKPGSMGRPHPGVPLRVLDGALEECAPGEVGTLALKADDPALFLEYRKQPDKWREAHRGGWYITGDQVYRDEDGYLWYVGRQDDLFKSRGYLIAPKEIEDAILEHPAVIEAAVVGQPDTDVGQRIAAFVVLAPGAPEHRSLGDEIRATVRGLLAPYKTPHVVTVVESLPKSPVGKILRRALR